MKVTLAQLNPIVGDIAGNVQKIADLLPQVAPHTDLIVFPELFLVGYPPRDLLERPAVMTRTAQAIQEVGVLSRQYPQVGLIVGAPRPTGKERGQGRYNAAFFLYRGEILACRDKSLLPSYDVFDETRYFDRADEIAVFPFKEEKLGISICEDAWAQETWCQRKYSFDPVAALAAQGATVLINISASPFQVGKEEIRYRLISGQARKFGVPFIYVNQVGGNDELIFDGRSLACDQRGEPLTVLPGFQEAVATVDLKEAGRAGSYQPPAKIASVHDALVLGLRDYLGKCGFGGALVGLSGGVDSAVTCCLAVRALGAANVLGVGMPSPFSSPGSLEDSLRLAANLGIDFKVIPITPIYEAYLASLAPHFSVAEIDLTLENVQARIRGNLLMALSNRFGSLVLSTGNKSELAVGYCTLYGDMSGGLSVLADVPKTMVYELAAYINCSGNPIPQEIIDKVPSAELRPHQTDQDTLPPYDILDLIIHYYLVEPRSYEEIVARGFEPEVVRWVLRAIDRNEYKRRQAAPGLKVTSKAFGMGRRIPIAARY